MRHKYLFDQETIQGKFAYYAYKRFTSREWFTYADVMADKLKLPSSAELTSNLSNCSGYREMKRAILAVRKAIEKAQQGSIKTNGDNKRTFKIKYDGNNDDPLSEIVNATVKKDLREYWEFCQESASFFPTSWLEYFFKDTRDLLDIRTKRKAGEMIMDVSVDRNLTHLEYLPLIYNYIKEEEVLKIRYKPYEENERTLVFHPHYLKEYNGRWWVLGHAEGHEPEFGYVLALDRIQEEPERLFDKDYIGAPKGFYKNLLNDIIGITSIEGAEIKNVRVRAHTLYMYKLIETKKLHHTQKEILPFNKYDDGEYGEFEMQIKINKEFLGCIFQMGSGLEITAPEEVRRLIGDEAKKTANLYNK